MRSRETDLRIARWLANKLLNETFKLPPWALSLLRACPAVTRNQVIICSVGRPLAPVNASEVCLVQASIRRRQRAQMDGSEEGRSGKQGAHLAYGILQLEATPI